MSRLEGKVALISGVSRGQGARVVFGDVLDEEGMKVEAEIRGLGGQASYLHLDVAVYALDSSTGTLAAVQTVTTLPECFNGRSQIDIHPSGRYQRALSCVSCSGGKTSRLVRSWKTKGVRWGS